MHREPGRAAVPVSVLSSGRTSTSGRGAGMFLSDMGAEVIHVETPAGDAMRHYRTLWGAEFLLDHDRNTFTEDILRNKQSLTVDLRHEEGREIVRRLADDADVFITNYRPQAAVKNGLDHETLSRPQPAPRLRARHELRRRSALTRTPRGSR